MKTALRFPKVKKAGMGNNSSWVDGVHLGKIRLPANSFTGFRSFFSGITGAVIHTGITDATPPESGEHLKKRGSRQQGNNSFGYFFD
ncbi:hypothetical protein [uncultured Desulfosarcina sp.]|uniref:hypothetical protein n=1 Tax=uncultured Desulfosarcina sp. TaxID=218289 RepID=UPI0029C858D3|nr:hypothetical protein [uncultured Desulfosarcina sp.]